MGKTITVEPKTKPELVVVEGAVTNLVGMSDFVAAGKGRLLETRDIENLSKRDFDVLRKIFESGKTVLLGDDQGVDHQRASLIKKALEPVLGDVTVTEGDFPLYLDCCKSSNKEYFFVVSDDADVADPLNTMPVVYIRESTTKPETNELLRTT